MEKQTGFIVDKLENMLDVGTFEMFEHYTNWYGAAGFGWAMVGVVIIICGFFTANYLKKEGDSIEALICMLFGVILGSIIIAANIPMIVSPEADAISRLIMDLRR